MPTPASETILAAGTVLTPDGPVSPGWVRVAGDRVVEVGAGTPPRPADLDLPAHTLAPGLVDIHCHGGGGASFTVGEEGQARTAAAAHLQRGTTSLVASLVTDRPERLESAIGVLSGLTDKGVLAGVHLEGPWLSRQFHGAHDPDLLTSPDPAVVGRLLDAGRGAIRMVTLAPELPGALDAVRRVVSSGAVAALGHTDATYEQTVAALDAGATVGTHLFNAMRPFKHRDPGPVGALLERDGAAVELVADGVHVHPSALRLVTTARPGSFILVSDAMAAAAAEDGDYRLGPILVQVRDGVARTPAGSIAGSTLTVAAAVRFLVAAGVPLELAVRAASQTPAEALGLDDVGRLAPGLRADLVVLDEEAAVQGVMRAGEWVVLPLARARHHA